MIESSSPDWLSLLLRDNSTATELEAYDKYERSFLPEDNSTGLGEFVSKQVQSLKQPLSKFDEGSLFLFPRSVYDTEDMEKTQSILRYGFSSEESGSNGGKKPKLMTTNVVGILNFEDSARDLGMSISITSRFFDGSGAESLADDWFLAYMMDKVLNFNILRLDFAADHDGAWRKLLMLMFPVYLKRAMEKGMYRQYVRREHNGSRPRGTIDVARHIALNLPFRGTIAYSTREYDMDNPVTQLIRHTIEFIRSDAKFGRQVFRSDDMDTRQCVQNIELATNGHYSPNDRAKIVYTNQTHPVRHPLYSEYRDLQHLCLMILTRKGISANNSSKNRVHGILFDCAWLWEEYLSLLLQRCYASDEYAVKHPRNKDRNKNTNGAQYFFEGNIGLIYPDFLLFPQTKGKSTKSAEDSPDKENRVVVADAKYKPEGNVSGEDYKQVLSYMYRFNSHLGLYLHPTNGSKPEDRTLSIIGREGCSVAKLGLPVVKDDGDATYRDYCSTMAERGEKFLEQIREKIGSRNSKAN